MQPSTDLDEICVNTIRTLSMDAVQEAKSGHPGAPMALAPAADGLLQFEHRIEVAKRPARYEAGKPASPGSVVLKE